MTFQEAKKLVGSYGFAGLQSLGEEYSKTIGKKKNKDSLATMIFGLRILGVPFELTVDNKQQRERGFILLRIEGWGWLVRYIPPDEV